MIPARAIRAGSLPILDVTVRANLSPGTDDDGGRKQTAINKIKT
jgi:hypothetical protein